MTNLTGEFGWTLFGPLAVVPFANVWMLLWGVAAAAPVLIHLWNKRKYREVTWAAMEFLLVAMRRHAQRIRLEQLILLLIRTAILLVLALALADPILSLFPSRGGGGSGQGQSHLIIVVDGSYSMAYRDENQTRFDRAKQVATSWIQRATQGDGFSVVLMGDKPQRVVDQPSFDASAVIREIDSLELPHGGANLQATLAEVAEMIRETEERHPRLTNHFVCIISDLDQSTWDAVNADNTRQSIANLAESSNLILADVGQTAGANLVISQARIRDSIAVTGKDVQIMATIENVGNVDVSNRRVEVLIDDNRQIHDETISLAAGEQTSITVSHRFKSPGDHRVRIRLDRDRLSVDDDRWISVDVRDKLSVLCVEGKHGAAQQIAIALQPSRDEASQIEATVVREGALLERPLTEFDAVYLCNIGRFGADESQLLYEYVHGGGTLVLFLGDQVQVENYNERIGLRSKQRLLPVELMGDSTAASHQFDPRGYRHPMLDVFRGQQDVGLISTPVSRYVRARQLTDKDDSLAQTVLGFTAGDPAIVEERIGSGRCILFTTSASEHSIDNSVTPPRPWTYFSLWRSFVPLVHESLNLGISTNRNSRNIRVSESITATIRNARSNAHVDLFRPDRRSERVAMEAVGSDSLWHYGDTRQSGFYEARLGPPHDRSLWFAVNINTEESQLTRTNTSELPDQFEQTLTISEGDDSGGLPPSRPYYRYLLGIVLVLLLLESFLAWYFGAR